MRATPQRRGRSAISRRLSDASHLQCNPHAPARQAGGNGANSRNCKKIEGPRAVGRCNSGLVSELAAAEDADILVNNLGTARPKTAQLAVSRGLAESVAGTGVPPLKLQTWSSMCAPNRRPRRAGRRCASMAASFGMWRERPTECFAGGLQFSLRLIFSLRLMPPLQQARVA